MAKPRKAFLTAEWRYLVMFNYRIDPESLGAHVPAGTELDRWGGPRLRKPCRISFSQNTNSCIAGSVA